MDKVYFYEGAVVRNNRCVEEHYCGYTFASSPQKARNNLTFRFKQEHGLTANTKVYLPGTIKTLERMKIDDGEQLSFL